MEVIKKYPRSTTIIQPTLRNNKFIHMKIYLDIDDTLINTDMYNMRPANHLKEFLEYMLRNHDVYWLTTHCNGDATTAVSYMAEAVPDEIVGFIKKSSLQNGIWQNRKL